MQNGEVRCAQSSGTTGVKESFCSLGLDDNLIHLMSLITATKKGIFFYCKQLLFLVLVCSFCSRRCNNISGHEVELHTMIKIGLCATGKVFRGLVAVVRMFV